MRFIIVTGLSGAGKSQTLRCLEDLGYFCVDNIPPSLLPSFAAMCKKNGGMDKVAVVVDIRGGAFFQDAFNALCELKDNGYSYEVLYLEAPDDVLIKRYKETRRAHPLAGGGRSLPECIAQERDQLDYMRVNAQQVINTGTMTAKKLAATIQKLFGANEQSGQVLVSVLSFGFKRGIPLDADMVFDMRFIPNPFYVQSLQQKPGLEPEVSDYVFSHEISRTFLEQLVAMITTLLPGYKNEGKNQLVVAIGCTGGMHRSVAMAEALFARLQKLGLRTTLEHRDIDHEMKRYKEG